MTRMEPKSAEVACLDPWNSCNPWLKTWLISKNEPQRPAVPFHAHSGAHRAVAAESRWTPHLLLSKKEHTPSSLSSDIVCRIGRPQDLHADVGLIGWAQR